MFFSEVWNNIPAGSRLTVRLTGDAGFGLSGSHTISTPNGPVLKGAITLAHFPLDIPIGAGEQHKVKFDALFAGTQATLTMVAEVVSPDGSTFQNPTTFTGKLSDSDKVLTVKIFANG